MNELLNEMPKSENGFNSAKSSIMNAIETDRTNDANIIFAYSAAQKLGIDYDVNQSVYESLPSLTYDHLVVFQKNNYNNKPYTYCIMASKDKVKMVDLEKLGKVQVLTLEEIFGY
jgi:hypothetical protein